MTLYVDIGSSRIKLVTGNGAFSNETSFSYEIVTLAEKLSIALKNCSNPGRVLVANVAGKVVAKVFQNYCMNTWSITPEFLAVKPEWGGIKNAYKNPQQLGIDRWLVMIAAWDKYKSDVCVIDCGTAITVDILTREGQHLGGYIIPGLDLMSNSLASNTILRNYSSSPAGSLTPGMSTEECMVNGAMLAITSCIEQILNNIYKEHGRKFICIMTGGASEKIREYLDFEIHYEQNLLFTGMKLVAGE